MTEKRNVDEQQQQQKGVIISENIT